MTDYLRSWREGDVRAAIADFVERVTLPGGPDFVPPRERVAVFDNDGTLWCERPAYVDALFLLERLRTMIDERLELGQDPVVRALLAGDLTSAAEQGFGALADVLLSTHEGISAEEYARAAADWLAAAEHPRFGVQHRALTYVPLLELLRAREFRVFIVTGGGVVFVRAVSDDLYGVPSDDVVGSAVQLSFERRADRIELVRRRAFLGSPNEGEPKPLAIQAHIGRRPILAAGAEPIMESAARLGWTVVSMRQDWARVFGELPEP